MTPARTAENLQRALKDPGPAAKSPVEATNATRKGPCRSRRTHREPFGSSRDYNGPQASCDETLGMPAPAVEDLRRALRSPAPVSRAPARL